MSSGNNYFHKLEQYIWNESSRLVANSIIFYNSFLLSELLEQMEEKKKIKVIEQIKKVSPITLEHINLWGRFNLTGQRTTGNRSIA